MELLKDKEDQIFASIKALATDKKNYSARMGEDNQRGRRRDSNGRNFCTRTRNFKNIPECFDCHKMGHVIANCRNRMNSVAPHHSSEETVTAHMGQSHSSKTPTTTRETDGQGRNDASNGTVELQKHYHHNNKHDGDRRTSTHRSFNRN
jgi:hypothetical protein